MHTPHIREDAPTLNPTPAAQDRYRQGWTRGRSFGCIALAVSILLYAPSLYGQGNDNALFIDQKGNVGIGTPDPKAKLEVAGSGHTGQISLQLRSGNASQWYETGSTQITFGYDNTAEYRHAIRTRHHGGQQAGNAIDFYVWKYDKDKSDAKAAIGGLHTMTLDGGNVGIGTTAPGHGLHVGGDKSVRFDLGSNRKLSLGKNGALEVDSDGVSGGRFMVTQEGKVGIGTTNPQGKLDVRDEVYVRSLSFTDPANGQPYPNNWIGMADNITGTTKWLHIGGITDGKEAEKKRRLALFADTTYVSGNAGIGTGSPEHRLHVAGGKAYFDGDVYVKGDLVYYWGPRNQWKHIQHAASVGTESHPKDAPSDRRFKTDLRPISSALEKIGHLRGVTYRWNQEALDYFTRHLAHTISAGPEATEAENRQLWQAEKAKIEAQLAGANLGLIAQEVESVVPEVVTTDADGYKAIKYPHLTALLIEAVKEQQALIAAQHADIARLQASNMAMQAQVQELQAHRAAARSTQAELEDIRAQLAHLGAAVQRVTATQQASATEVGRVIMPRQ